MWQVFGLRSCEEEKETRRSLEGILAEDVHVMATQVTSLPAWRDPLVHCIITSQQQSRSVDNRGINPEF
jgi:hypothetical protein